LLSWARDQKGPPRVRNTKNKGGSDPPTPEITRLTSTRDRTRGLSRERLKPPVSGARAKTGFSFLWSCVYTCDIRAIVYRACRGTRFRVRGKWSAHDGRGGEQKRYCVPTTVRHGDGARSRKGMYGHKPNRTRPRFRRVCRSDLAGSKSMSHLAGVPRTNDDVYLGPPTCRLPETRRIDDDDDVFSFLIYYCFFLFRSTGTTRFTVCM